MITAARNSVTGTPCAASSAPVSWRLARWWERSAESSPRPPRYTIRDTPARFAAWAKLRAACRSRSANSPFTRPHRVRQVVRDVDPLERQWQRRWVEQVGDDHRRLREPDGEGPRVAAHQDELVSLRCEQRDEPPADVAARADDEDPHDAPRGQGDQHARALSASIRSPSPRGSATHPSAPRSSATRSSGTAFPPTRRGTDGRSRRAAARRRPAAGRRSMSTTLTTTAARGPAARAWQRRATWSACRGPG